MYWLFLLAAEPPSPAPAVRQEILAMPRTAADDSGTQGPYCTARKSWCLSFERSESGEEPIAAVTVAHGAAHATAPIAVVHDQLRFWDEPISYRTGDDRDGLILGLRTWRTEGYSGGGAGVNALKLVRAEMGADGKLVLAALDDWIPFGGSALIRACFSERDIKLRRGLCQDDYELEVKIRPDGKLVHDMPSLLYISEATVSPGFAARDQDNSDPAFLKKLTRRDFLPRTDQRCTFTRTMKAAAERDRYVLDAPDCSEFTAGQE